MKNWMYEFKLNSEQANVASVYYTSLYFQRKGLVNPITAKPYSAEELSAIEEKSSRYEQAPEDAYIGMKTFSGNHTFFYGKEEAEKIVSYATPLLLNGETGELTDGDGKKVASPLK